MKKKKIKSVLFVCTGNSCRSVMAEGLLKKMLEENGKGGILVRSAGISAISGFPPTDKTVVVMEAEGIDVSQHKTTKLTPELIRDTDIILTMDIVHKDEVVSLVPEAEGKTHLLKEYVNKKNDPSGYTVPDPIGRPLEVYERVRKMIKESLKELVKKL